MISHMVLVTEISGTNYLCDVGMSSFLLTAPIKLRDGFEQKVGNDLFRVSRDGERWRLDVERDGDWTGVYQFDVVEQSGSDIATISDSVAAQYHDRSLLFAARVDGDIRHKLSGNRLSTYRPGAEPERRLAPDVDALRTMLAEVFGITLPQSDDLDPALQRVIEVSVTPDSPVA